MTTTDEKKLETGVGTAFLTTERGEHVLWVEGRGWEPSYFSFHQG